MGEPGGLLSMGSHTVGHNWSDLVAVAEAYKYFYLFYIDFFNLWLSIRKESE